MSPSMKGSAAAPKGVPESAELRRMVRVEADTHRELLRRASAQLAHDAQLMALHANGIAPERAVLLVAAVLDDLRRLSGRLLAARRSGLRLKHPTRLI